MECGECTLCCDLFPIEEFNKPPDTKCDYCDKGCLLHGTKKMPLECSNFECAYYQMEKIPIDLRPDKCGIIFEKLDDDIFYGTVNHKVKISDKGKAQIDAFLKQGFSVILASLKEKQPKYFISEKHNKQEIHDKFLIHLTARYGRVWN